MPIAPLWWNSTPADFQSSFGLTESIERLEAAIQAQREGRGKVAESCVLLHRCFWFGGNAFKIFYRGRFVQSIDGRVSLVGAFRMHSLTRAFMAIWCIGILSGTVIAPALTGASVTVSIGIVVIGAAIIVAGTAFADFGRWLAGDDPEWLSNLIRSALCSLDHQSAQKSRFMHSTARSHSHFIHCQR